MYNSVMSTEWDTGDSASSEWWAGIRVLDGDIVAENLDSADGYGVWNSTAVTGEYENLLDEDCLEVEEWSYTSEPFDTDNMYARDHDREEILSLLEDLEEIHEVVDRRARIRENGTFVMEVEYEKDDSVERPHREVEAYPRDEVNLDYDGPNSPSSIAVLTEPGILRIYGQVETEELDSFP